MTNLLSGKKKKFFVGELDGFITTSKIAKGRPVYEITLMQNGQNGHPVNRISSNYIRNYDEVRAIMKKVLVP
jgi:hypothetical protein